MIDYALTVRAPWATSIVLLGKDVENRTWRTNYRGRLWIHAGCKKPAASALEAVRSIVGDRRFAIVQRHRLWEIRGAIIGHVTLVDCVQEYKSPWADPDSWHWVLADPKPLRPIPMNGKLGLWAYGGPT